MISELRNARKSINLSREQLSNIKLPRAPGRPQIKYENMLLYVNRDNFGDDHGGGGAVERRVLFTHEGPKFSDDPFFHDPANKHYLARLDIPDLPELLAPKRTIPPIKSPIRRYRSASDVTSVSSISDFSGISGISVKAYPVVSEYVVKKLPFVRQTSPPVKTSAEEPIVKPQETKPQGPIFKPPETKPAVTKPTVASHAAGGIRSRRKTGKK